MSQFKKRIKKGLRLQESLIDYLNDNNIGYFITGYEGLKSENNASIKILKNNTTTTKFVRYYPDLTLASNKETYLLEVKNSSGIEKECWESYKTLSKNLNIKVLFYLRNNMVYSLEDIVFKRMKEWCSISKMKIPVVNKYWRSPRELPYDLYLTYKSRLNGRTSGCSFAFIDFEKSKGYDREILKKLA